MKTLIPDCGKWKWQDTDPSVLIPWFRNGVVSGGELVKKNDVRSVWRVTDENGKKYFAKIETRSAFSFRDKAREEFNAAKMLSALGIPCVQFAAFGSLGRQTVLVSNEVDHAVSAKQFWFGTCSADPEKRKLFLQNLQKFLLLLVEKKIRHHDFHAGNVLVRPDDCSLMLVDLLGISCEKSANGLELANICVDFLPEIRQEEAEFLAGPLGKEPAAVFAAAVAVLQDRIAREWSKRKEQILSGDSKFSRTIRRDGRVFEVVSTEWYGDRELPADLETACLAESLPAPEAEKRFLAMFRARLEGKSFAPRYVVREICDGNHILYSPREK